MVPKRAAEVALFWRSARETQCPKQHNRIEQQLYLKQRLRDCQDHQLGHYGQQHQQQQEQRQQASICKAPLCNRNTPLSGRLPEGQLQALGPPGLSGLVEWGGPLMAIFWGFRLRV